MGSILCLSWVRGMHIEVHTQNCLLLSRPRKNCDHRLFVVICWSPKVVFRRFSISHVCKYRHTTPPPVFVSSVGCMGWWRLARSGLEEIWCQSIIYCKEEIWGMVLLLDGTPLQTTVDIYHLLKLSEIISEFPHPSSLHVRLLALQEALGIRMVSKSVSPSVCQYLHHMTMNISDDLLRLDTKSHHRNNLTLN